MSTSSYENLWGVATGYMRSSILSAAAELDCFTHIIAHGNKRSAKALAADMQTDMRGTEALLNALAAVGMLVKNGIDDDAFFAVPEEYCVLLDSRHPETCVPILRHMANGQRSWSRLAWSLKEGTPQHPQPSILGAEADKVSFIQGMNSIAVRLVGATMQTIQDAGIFDFSAQNPRILDIGGASGTYAQSLLQTVPNARVTIFDLPVGIQQAKKRFATSAFADSIDFVEGDFMRMALPSGYDFAWLSAIIHSFGRDECQHLYKNILQALVPGGMLAIRDYFMSPERTHPPEGALFGINMFVNTPHGRVYTFDETKYDLEQAGFQDVCLAVPSPTMSAIVTARHHCAA